MSSEFDLIRNYFKPLSGEEGLGLLDDAALFVPGPGEDIVLTKDMIVSDVHFRACDNPADIAWKALAVNISDLIAKGARPNIYLLGLALDRGLDEKWLQAFAAGLQAAQDYFKVKLVGGDTTRSKGGSVISVTALGTASSGGMIKRSHAEIGDDLYVTGTIGNGALGLKILQDGLKGYDELVQHYYRPKPKLAHIGLLRAFANAAIDISDGLAADAGHLAKASCLRVVINKDHLPLSEEAGRYLACNPEAFNQLLTGGDDYEVVFAVSPNQTHDMRDYCAQHGLHVTKIGRFVEGQGVEIREMDGSLVKLEKLGYDHFITER